MSFSKCSFVAASFAVLLGSVAQADVSAEDIWSDFQKYAQGIGFQVDGTTSRSGDTLTVSEIQVFGGYSADQGSTQLLVSTLSFVENSDGSVTVVMPESIPVVSIFKDANGNQATSTSEYKFEDLDVLASGDPDQLQYDVTAAAIKLISSGIQFDDDTLADDLFSGEFSVNNVTGTSTALIAQTRTLAQDYQAESLTYEIVAKDPESIGQGRVTGDIRGVAFSGTAQTPLQTLKALDFNTMLKNGFSAEGTITTGPTTVQIASTDTDMPLQGSFVSAASNLDIQVGPQGITYSGQQTDLQVTLEPGMMPFPLNFGAKTAGGNLTFPVQKSDTPSNFALGLNFDGITLSDSIWTLLDPSAQIPRDPATLILGLNGTAKVLYDLLDPSAFTDAGTVPGTLETANLETLQLSVGGAELTGTGAFTFDNSNPASPPMPVGRVDLRLDGANGLLDRLVASGLLPQEQAMAARLMMGLLAVPLAQPDSLSSRIEINEQGHVLANGQRIQ